MLGSNCADPASVSINDTAANRYASRKAKVICSFLAKSSDNFASADIFAILR